MKYRNLIVGILGQAVKDINKKTVELDKAKTSQEKLDIKNKADAELFLDSHWCMQLADSIGIDKNKIIHKVAKIKEEQNDGITGQNQENKTT